MHLIRIRGSLPYIERFHSRGKHLCKFIGTKESVYIRKDFNSQRIFSVHQHGRRFIVLEHQYGRRDVMWKRTISPWRQSRWNATRAPVKSCRTLAWIIFDKFTWATCKWTQQLPTLAVVGQQCSVRLHGAKILTSFKLCATTPNYKQQHATGCANRRNM